MIDEEMKGTEDYDDEIRADTYRPCCEANANCQGCDCTEKSPKVVTLCGSTRFMDDFIRVQRELTLKGWIVISVGLFGHQEGMDMDGGTKKMLDELHFRKIDLSDAIYVINKTRPYALCCNSWFDGQGCRCYPKAGYGYRNEWYELRPYIGSSTRNEIEYAKKTGKEIIYMERVK